MPIINESFSKYILGFPWEGPLFLNSDTSDLIFILILVE